MKSLFTLNNLMMKSIKLKLVIYFNVIIKLNLFTENSLFIFTFLAI